MGRHGRTGETDETTPRDRHRLGTAHTLRREFTAYVPSRKQLEWQIRSRTALLPNVRIAHRDVDAPKFDGEQQRVTDGLIPEKVVVAGASRAEPVGLGMLLYEDQTWGLTTFTLGNISPPQNFAEMCALAKAALPESHAGAIAAAEPLGEVAFHRYPAAGGGDTTRCAASRPVSSRSGTRSRATTRPTGRA